jgi:tetratricopeptide (TPR) repeat protein
MKWESVILIGSLVCGIVSTQEKPATAQASAGGGENKSNQASQEKKSAKPLTLYDVPTPPTSSIDSQDEAVDFFKITQTKDPAERIKLIEDFLGSYPKSSRTTQVHLWATFQYQDLNQPDKMIQHGESLLPQAGSNPGFLAALAMAYNATGVPEKAIALAEQALNSLDKAVMPEQAKPDLWNAEKKRLEALNRAAAGSGYLSRYEISRKKSAEKANIAGSASQPPDSKSPAAGNSTNSGKTISPEEAELLSKSREYLQKSIDLLPNYDFAYFQLGILFVYQNNAAQAMDAFAHAVSLGGGFSASSQKNLEYLYKLTHKNSTAGMEQIVEKARLDLKSRLPQPVPAETESAAPANQN